MIGTEFYDILSVEDLSLHTSTLTLLFYKITFNSSALWVVFGIPTLLSGCAVVKGFDKSNDRNVERGQDYRD